MANCQALAVLFVLLASSCSHMVLAQGNSTSDAELTAAILQDLESLRLNVLSFWLRYGLDNESGGIHGTLNRSGSPITPTAKGLIQQTRHIWAFSTHYLHKSNLSSVTNASSLPALRGLTALESLNTTEQLAQSAFDFVVDHMQDTSNSLWYWNVTRNGSRPVQRNKVIPGQWHVLFAFSQYWTAFQQQAAVQVSIPTAKDLALKTFRAMDEAWHTPTYGGYLETAANGFPNNLPAPNTTATGANSTVNGTVQDEESVIDALAANNTDPFSSGEVVTVANASTPTNASTLTAVGDEPRSLTTLLHGVEALTALHKITNDSQVAARLLELLDIMCYRLDNSSGLLHSTYIPAAGNATWRRAEDATINYGTNFLVAWMVPDTWDYLLTLDPTSPIVQQFHADCTTAALAAGTAAVREAHDQQYSGFFESFDPKASANTDGANPTGISRVKVWWIQNEALLALYKLHKNQAKNSTAGAGAAAQPNYLQLLADTAKFLREHQTDNEVAGEQFWQVEQNGTYVESADVDKSTKGNRWKAAYITSRAPLYLKQWMAADQQAV